jgi:glycosyltransferase involved in cell wall biosynthesis
MNDSQAGRATVDGKFFRLGGGLFTAKGVTYGPFEPDSQGCTFASPQRTAQDFKQIQELRANLLRVYYVPPRWFLDLAAEHHLKVFVDIPWSKHLCFLDGRQSQQQARRAVREAVEAVRDHAAVFACSVVNEIPAEIVRWSGARRVENFIDSLIEEGKSVDAACLFTFASFPPTEFLAPSAVDFTCFNVYLHQQSRFEAYLDRLQTLADAKPLLLGEFGMDGLREGPAAQAEFLRWQIELGFRAGVAGTVIFSFTDDWYRGGCQVQDWAFGLTDRQRRPKPAFGVVQHCFERAPYFAPARPPKVSVVVSTFNGARTLKACLESLGKLRYPDYEVIIVDDGSTDATPQIASLFPAFRYLRQPNRGLSAARNAGIGAAQGEIVAFTDDDCRVDENWLFHLVGDLQRGDFDGIGGHNFLPPEDSCVAAAVMASPGGPAHVMLTDREAEHVPGCNMAFLKSALDQIGGFDPVFRQAGDDVDLCWRLLDAGYKLGFSHAGFVWHYRRSTVKAYLRQQAGYGEAEALLLEKHPERFNAFGGSRWQGRIYSNAISGLLLNRPVIYHGVFGSGFFQRLYSPAPFEPLLLCGSLGYHFFVTLPLTALAVYWEWAVPLLIASVTLSLGVCVVAAAQAKLPRHKRRFWSRPLVALMFFLQPIVRGWPRLWRRPNLLGSRRPPGVTPVHSLFEKQPPAGLLYWSDGGLDRFTFLQRLRERLEKEGWFCQIDSGWSTHDLECWDNLWSRQVFTTTCEDLDRGKRNLRCRLDSRWTLPAWLVLMGAAAVITAAVVLGAQRWPWVWMSLVLAPLTIWMLEDRRARAIESLAWLVDDEATQSKLTRLEISTVG